MALPKRKTMRYKGFDYSQFGAYFLTICTHNKENLFWDMDNVYKRTLKNEFDNIIDSENLPLTELGKVVERNIENLKNVYVNMQLVDYVIMPNHVHLLIAIMIDENNPCEKNPNISNIVSQFKSKITKEIGQSIWQKNFYDHIIRNEKEFDNCIDYIDSNPRALELKILEKRKNK